MRFLLLEFSLKGPCVLPLISSFLLLKEKMGRTLLRVTFYPAFLEKISSSTNDSSEAVTEKGFSIFRRLSDISPFPLAVNCPIKTVAFSSPLNVPSCTVRFNYSISLNPCSLLSIYSRSIGPQPPSVKRTQLQTLLWNQIGENQTHASFTPIEVVLPPPVRMSSYGVPVPLEPVTILSYYSSPMTVARWYEVPGFNQEFGLQNPEWKMLQDIPCSTLLEGAIKHTMNSILPLRVAHSQILFLMAENATYRAEIARLNACCDSLSTKLEATVKYCNYLAQKLQDRLHAEA
ncbi:Hypothetical protein ZOSMA_159G00150 [Zostera marina]|uniref:Uncharacterized protein n=1 Tax=Zostera marina TaxID=29655 RepID=A0A0K9PV28_ZOSMR|nr:Hypothetical protein ZOSMA_159G00150 [Zostera marina]